MANSAPRHCADDGLAVIGIGVAEDVSSGQNVESESDKEGIDGGSDNEVCRLFQSKAFWCNKFNSYVRPHFLRPNHPLGQYPKLVNQVAISSSVVKNPSPRTRTLLTRPIISPPMVLFTSNANDNWITNYQWRGPLTSVSNTNLKRRFWLSTMSFVSKRLKQRRIEAPVGVGTSSCISGSYCFGLLHSPHTYPPGSENTSVSLDLFPPPHLVFAPVFEKKSGC